MHLFTFHIEVETKFGSLPNGRIQPAVLIQMRSPGQEQMGTERKQSEAGQGDWRGKRGFGWFGSFVVEEYRTEIYEIGGGLAVWPDRKRLEFIKSLFPSKKDGNAPFSWNSNKRHLSEWSNRVKHLWNVPSTVSISLMHYEQTKIIQHWECRSQSFGIICYKIVQRNFQRVGRDTDWEGLLGTKIEKGIDWSSTLEKNIVQHTILPVDTKIDLLENIFEDCIEKVECLGRFRGNIWGKGEYCSNTLRLDFKQHIYTVQSALYCMYEKDCDVFFSLILCVENLYCCNCLRLSNPNAKERNAQISVVLVLQHLALECMGG